ncbi:MAG: hypothetical protein ACT4PZ_15935 [Panacagrimonas sp.]
MSISRISPILRLASLAGLAATLAMQSTGATAAAKRLYEQGIAEAGERLVAYASAGAVNEAFESANELRKPNDEGFARSLEHTRAAVTSDIAKLGGQIGPVQQIDELRFGTCLTREYRVKYRNGEQRWMVKFRRGSAGWHLADLSVATLPPRRGLLDQIASVIDPEPR